MKVPILYDGGSEEWSEADVAAVLANVHEVRRSLRRHGHVVTLVPVYLHDLKWPSRLQRSDLVFNLCEGINGHARYEDWVLGALELTGVPFTGCRAAAVTLCHRKHVANWMARELIPALEKKRGEELWCNDCHMVDGKGTAKILGQPRDSRWAAEWMATHLVEDLQAADDKPLRCKSCHGGAPLNSRGLKRLDHPTSATQLLISYTLCA